VQKAVRAACCSHVEGMNEHSLPTEDEAAFEAYLDTLAAALHHRSRKQPLRDYCTGLLLPEGRKSMEPMAARLAPARTRTMHKTLLNFVSEGAWSDEAVLAAMRSQVLPAMQAHGPLRFWIVDESGMPKKGKHSVGVARQYCGEVGKVDNCQVMVSLSVANEAACLPLAAQLYLPEAWAVDEERRSKAPRRRLPEQTSTRPGADPRRARRGGAARRRPGR
jgi:SRSO17 transposase